MRVELAVPGRSIVVDREPHEHHEHEDVYIAVRDAFDAVRRTARGPRAPIPRITRTHEEPPEGRIARLFLVEGYGFISTPRSAEIYFHRNAVLDEPFDELDVGTAVRFAEELGEQGPAGDQRARGRTAEHAETALTVGPSDRRSP